MFVRQSTRRRRHKPAKPNPSFPLTPHNNGQWCKKIRGKIRFFGIWAEPEAALENYLRVAADLHAGREPRPSTVSAEGLTVKQLCNHYLTYQHRRSQAGEIGPRWFEDCRTVLDSFVSFAGPGRLASDLAPDDFLKYRQRLSRQGLAGRKGLGVHALTRAITVVRSMLKYAYEMNLIDNPIKYGKAFEQPSSTLKRKSRRTSQWQAVVRCQGNPVPDWNGPRSPTSPDPPGYQWGLWKHGLRRPHVIGHRLGQGYYRIRPRENRDRTGCPPLA